MDSISRRSFLKKSGLAVVSTALLPRSAISNTEKRPNIVLILADDMGFSDIGCYGGEIETPNLDALSGDGVRFSQFYNGARCCPTRASLLTGLYAHQTGIGHMTDSSGGAEGYRGDLNNHCLTIAQVLKSAGYSTYMAGKWHLTPYIKPGQPQHNWPCQRGFDKFYGTIIGANSFFSPTTLALNNSLLPPPRDDYYYTDRLSDLAVQNIRDHKHAGEKNKPFFLYLSYTAPHWPLHALQEDIDRYRDRFSDGWDELRKQRYQRMLAMGLIRSEWKLSDRDSSQLPWEEAEDREWQQRRMEVYAAQVDRMDQGIGRVIAELSEAGELDNTLILFLADNGGCAEELRPSWMNFLRTGSVSVPTTGEGREVRFLNRPDVLPGAADTYQSYGVPWANLSNTPFRRYKHWVHEGGIATPMICHWPQGIKPKGTICHDPGHLIDIMATCVDVAGANYPSQYRGSKIWPLEGVSLTPVFLDKKLSDRSLFWEHEGNQAVREGNWKLVLRRQEPWELYDLAADRSEMIDLAERFPERVKRMEASWNRWARRARVLPRR